MRKDNSENLKKTKTNKKTPFNEMKTLTKKIHKSLVISRPISKKHEEHKMKLNEKNEKCTIKLRRKSFFSYCIEIYYRLYD